MTLIAQKTPERNSNEWFLIFLRGIIRGDERYKKIVQPVIKEAKELMQGTKDYYTISRDKYYNIMLLHTFCQPELTNIDAENITMDDYQILVDKINKYFI